MTEQTAEQRGMEILAREATPDVTGVAQLLVDHEVAAWEWDPDVREVVGLVDRKTRRAYVIVYADGDWETTADLDNLARHPAVRGAR